MKATELRIGNLIQLNKKWFEKNPGLSKTEKIISIDSIGFDYLLPENYKINGYNIGNLEPIPLTEEWLLKFGWLWNEETKSYEKYPNGDARMHLAKRPVNGSYTMFNYVLKAQIAERIWYVHQLQNLFFALTGEELEIK